MSTRYLGYVRVSKADRSKSERLGLDAQRAAIVLAAAAKGWEIVGWYKDDGVSGKSTDRPGLQSALHLLERPRTRNADGLVAAKLDRLSRSVIDFGELLDLSRRQKWSLAVLDFDLDTSTATGRMIAGIVVQFAQFEREVIGERTRAALAIAKANGAQLGKPSPLTDEVKWMIRTWHSKENMSASAIARRLIAEGVPTARGGQWHHSVIAAFLHRDAIRLTTTPAFGECPNGTC
jgi:DNA invertase Pin-like site-specific DNA recombinase